MPAIDYHRRKRFISAMVAGTDLGYREDVSIPGPATDGRHILMPPYNPLFTKEEEVKWMFGLIHECLHNQEDNRPDFDLFGDPWNVNPETEWGMILNVVVDHNIECKFYGSYAGADQYLRDSYGTTLPPIIAGVLKELPTALQAVLAFDVLCRSLWLLGTDYNVYHHLTPEAKEYFDRLVADEELVKDYMTPRPGGVENYEMAKRLLLTALDDEEQAEEKIEQGTQDGNGDGESQEGKGEGQDSKGSGEGDEEGEARTAEAMTEYRDQLLHDHGKLKANEVGTNSHVAYKDSDIDPHVSYEPPETRFVVPEDNDRGEYTRRHQVEAAMSNGLSHKVRNVLKVMSQAKYQGGKKRGKINKRAIASVTTGNDRLFRSKQVQEVFDTAVYVLVDCSGSMWGSKYTHAAAAAGMLTDCLGKLGINHEIGGFTFHGAYDTIYGFKPFGTKADKTTVINRMCSSDVSMANNTDGDSINYCFDRLMAQPNKRKIMIVLSDGSPAGGPPGCSGYTKRVVQEIEKRKDAEIYGIGIEDDNVQRFYKHHSVISHADQLEAELLSVMKKALVGE